MIRVVGFKDFLGSIPAYYDFQLKQYSWKSVQIVRIGHMHYKLIQILRSM